MAELFQQNTIPVYTLDNVFTETPSITGIEDIVDFSQITGSTRPENYAEVNIIKLLQSIFGDGNDGNVEITSNTTLIRDMFYIDLTIKAGYTLYPSGYRIFVRNRLTIEATAVISRNGLAGGLSSGSLYGAPAGGAGGGGGGWNNGSAEPGENPGNLAKCLGSNANNGGAGGASMDPNIPPGSGGNGGDKSGTVYNFPRGIISAYMLYDVLPVVSGNYFGDIIKTNPAGGGGGGGGACESNRVGFNAGNGGNAGCGGGIIGIFAKNIVNNGTIEAKGEDGANGGDGHPVCGGFSLTCGYGAGGGGAGGNGGILLLTYISKTGSGTTDVSAGSGGAGGIGKKGCADGDAPDGTAGQAGVAGKVLELKI